MMSEKEVLTTGEVAKVCNVAPRTVSKWFDSGQLKGYRIPGSKDRRIPVPSLMQFMKDHGIPMDGIQSGKTRVLIADSDKEITDVLNRVLTDQAGYEVFTAATEFEAGVECERTKPHVMLLDLHIGAGDGKAIAGFISRNDELAMTSIIAMSAKLTDGQTHQLRSQGFDSVLKKPFQVRQIIEMIEKSTSVVH